MDTTTAFILYITLFRLSIIIAGITCIVLGYRLFARGVFPASYGKLSGEDVIAEIGGAKLTLRNAAPGSSFALFGVIIIIAMFVTGAPEVTMEMLNEGDIRATFRGEQSVDSVTALSRSGLDHLQHGSNQLALTDAHTAIQKLAPTANDLAWIFFKTNSKLNQSILLSQLAVNTEPQNPAYLHTLAEVQYALGNSDKALATLQQAQSINPVFDDQIKLWKSQLDSGNT
ncbi:tetratricopeptide repeat protein, partial [Kaarinaea lacus]